jgi:Bifunctional DNA primase/polymerase, N-terminal/AAA domain
MRIFSYYFTTWHEGMEMRKTAIAAVRNGYAVVPVRPGGKVPLCTLTAREVKAAGVDHACGVHHAITVDRVADRVFKRLAREYGPDVNIGIVAHPSRLVVVDIDTAESVTSFLESWARAEDDERRLGFGPTVTTPGSRRDGEWKHHDGGHWYFNVPAGLELPIAPGKLVLPGGAEVSWGRTMTVAPPSKRDEGLYLTNGEIGDVPLYLVQEIRSFIDRKVERNLRNAERWQNDTIARWSMDTTWADLLVPRGWNDTGKADRRCGCPVFEKPGGGTSGDRSAIGHENDCPIYENVEGHGALHLFTTDPPLELAEWCHVHSSQTLTKLQFVAAMDHAGDELAAKIALGLEPDYGQLWDASGHSDNDPAPYTSEGLSECPDASEQGEQSPDTHPLTLLAERLANRVGVPIAHAKQELGKEWMRRETRAELDRYLGNDGRDGSTWLPRLDLAAVVKTHTPTETNTGILERSDGATLFPLGRMHQLFGQSEAGKTFLMLCAIAQRAARGQRSLYCDFEDTIHTFVDRFRQLGIDIEAWVDAGLIAYANPAEPPTNIAGLLEAHFDLIVVDSLSEVVASIADGSMKDGALIRRVLHKFRELADAGAAVVIIAHGSEKVDVPASSLGASEIRQAMTGQDILLHNQVPFSNRSAGNSMIYVTKDRTSAAGGDVDVAPRMANKAQRRLWGEMRVSPTPPDTLLSTGWHTTIDIEPASHAVEPPKERKIDMAERALIAYLLEHGETARVADMTDDLIDDNDGMAERTIRRAVRQMLEDGLVHVIDETSSPSGSKPSPVIKLGPAPAPPKEDT